MSFSIKQTPFLMLIILILSLSTAGQSQINNAPVKTLAGESVTANELDDTIQSIMEKLDMPGLSIAIINDAEVAYYNVFGVTNMETKEKVTKKTIFEGASLSKPIFAWFALKMADKGFLDLDKPLYEYLPHPGIAEESQEDYKLITARMVLAHSTGFPNHSGGKKIALKFKPGTDFSYSGEAYQYLAAIIGQLNGVGWQEDLNRVFQETVTQPLGMENTSFVWSDYFEKHKAYGHKDGTPTDNSTGGWDGKTFFAFSSLHSEAREYSRFVQAILKGEGLKDDTYNDMFKSHTIFNEDTELRKETGQTGWGLGFAQKPSPYGMMHLHTGNNHDFQAYVMIVPERQYGLVLFSNSGKMLDFINELEDTLGDQF